MMSGPCPHRLLKASLDYSAKPFPSQRACVLTEAQRLCPHNVKQGAIETLEKLAATIPDSWVAGQFTNHANSKVHYETTGPEIWRQTHGKVDILVAGAGTGGTAD